jgi:hypothetical protein
MIPSDVYEARKLLLNLQDIEREQGQVKDLKKRVAQDYDDHIAKLEEEKQEIRNVLSGFVQLHGKTIVPDVGTVFVQNRKARLSVVDDDKAIAAALRWDVPGARLWKPALVKSEFLKVATERLETTGEVADGTELLPAGASVAIRWKGDTE